MSIMYASSSEQKKEFILELIKDGSFDKGIIDEWLTGLLKLEETEYCQFCGGKCDG